MAFNVHPDFHEERMECLNVIWSSRTLGPFFKGPFIARYLSMRVTYPVKFSQNTELERLLVHTP